MTDIHPTAIISSDAVLGKGVRVGPFCIIEEGVRLGNNCELAASAQVRRGSKVGNDCYIGSGALIGADPHYLGFDRDITSGVEVGHHNTIREYVTIHRSISEGGVTRLGSDGFLMNGAHIGHDCELGDHNVIANNCLLGGHVRVGSHCFLGGSGVFHQFIRIGDYVMAQGMVGMSHDIPPYVIAAEINRIAGINVVGLRRGGFDSETRKEIKELFGLVYRKNLSPDELIGQTKNRTWSSPARKFIDFFEEKSKKGVCLRMRSA